MAAQPVTSPLEQPLTYKTWVLKVSIHCEGCKRKVKKVLHSVEGVYTVNVDTKQQKAVVTGNVALAADTLIKKLVKSGKHAEMWPEIAEQREKSNKSKKKEKEKEKAKEKEKETDSESSSEEEGGGGHGGPNKPKQTVKFEVVHGEAGGAPAKTSEGGGRSVRFSDNIQVVELKSEGNKPETGTPGDNPPAAEKKASETDGGAVKSGGGGGSGSGSGSGGKKKKKKGHNKSAAGGGPSSGGAPASTGSANSNAGPQPVNYSPPPHHGHQYSPPPGPSHYYAPPASVYVASHGMANPTSSYTTSYYASQPVHSYTHTYHGPETEPPPFDLDYYPQQPLDSFELFSDENPNGCSVM